MRVLLFFLGLLWPAIVQAGCEGRDLRGDLSPAVQADLQDALAEILYPEGNHWIATKDDTVLHLVGTMHLNYPQMDAIVERLTPTLTQADAFYFEILQEEMKDWERKLAADPSPVLITSGPTLVDLISEEDWATLSSEMADRGIPSWMGAKMRPWFLSMTLALPACIIQDPNGTNGLDARLTQLAKEHGIPQYSLESIEDLMTMFDAYSIEEQAQSLARMAGTFQNIEDQIATMASLYFEEKHAEVFVLGRMLGQELSGLTEAEFDAEWAEFEQQLLIERNANWMTHILEIKDQTAVIAVGVGHFSDEHGLLNQLEQAGYSLTRAEF
ncbi:MULTISPECIES: TraB/GumN family protein [unclassified Ruegeria]|uniref:TraB/GumN family protein n=1 Tax=unclassified Ruegeria TaxID=2625375 RepID=UPI00148880EF|nr:MULTISPECIES: TraB/GumN family protein [unclassified Ruegeria]NOD75713.1 TraB/GumN family protein [Ruegeria sp. HKCCD4332]NOD88976.1 TraB/GumN family protein [Ruegeria sp. HKCCD4318]NOE14438.1 TraB/GumN family protein [Ruegeria sp. HKCCD4318-2]NOG10041.1 TraB/GumN family protein [Ruegeria sp. HKCCD4315]